MYLGSPGVPLQNSKFSCWLREKDGWRVIEVLDPPAVTFDRAAFESKVSERSPLSPEQFDKMLGGTVNCVNKWTAWQLLNLSSQGQFLVWNWVKNWPEGAIVERVR